MAKVPKATDEDVQGFINDLKNMLEGSGLNFDFVKEETFREKVQDLIIILEHNYYLEGKSFSEIPSVVLGINIGYALAKKE